MTKCKEEKVKLNRLVGVYDQYDYLDEKRDALTKLDREIESILYL